MKTLQEQLIEAFPSHSGKWLYFDTHSKTNNIVCSISLSTISVYAILTFENDGILVENYDEFDKFYITGSTVVEIVAAIRNYLINQVQSKIDIYTRQLNELQTTINY
jgi:hypothetical protein